MYKRIIRPLFFCFDAEAIHHFVFKIIKFLHFIPGVSQLTRFIYKVNDDRLKRTVFGLEFENPVGLAAGFDKDAKLFNELSNFGFGFIEIGTLTLVGQTGNLKPRLFRLGEDAALINRMGFNNDGTELIKKRLKKSFNVIIGGNIGKNKITPNSDAKSDYIYCFKELYNQVDYFVVNVSSPNTPGLRELQSKEFLNDLFCDLNKIRFESSNPKPILLKISPDLNEQKILEILDVISVNKIDGIIATNTSVNFPKLNSKNRNEKGGLSGAPIYDRSNEVISFISKSTNGKLPIIGVGGISSVDQAIEKIKAGAHLIQIYTGLIYEGPGFIKRINKELLNYKL